MASDTLMAPLPSVVLPPGAQITFEAIDPTTGSAVTGVTVSNIAILGVDLSSSDQAALKAGPFMLVPGPQG